jgi:SET domain-containing protein
MFLKPTYVTTSPISGVGLYTKDKIKAGELVARWEPMFDKTFDDETYAQLPEVTQHYIHKHGTKSEDGLWKLGMDGDQYINHSDQPNLIRRDDGLFADREIAPGEELTCDYRPYRNDIL